MSTETPSTVSAPDDPMFFGFGDELVWTLSLAKQKNSFLFTSNRLIVEAKSRDSAGHGLNIWEKWLNFQCCFLWIFCSDKFQTGATKELDVGTVNRRFLRIQQYGDTFFTISWKSILGLHCTWMSWKLQTASLVCGKSLKKLKWCVAGHDFCTHTSLTFSKSWSWQNNHRWHSHRPDHGTMDEEKLTTWHGPWSNSEIPTQKHTFFYQNTTPRKEITHGITIGNPKASVYATSWWGTSSDLSTGGNWQCNLVGQPFHLKIQRVKDDVPSQVSGRLRPKCSQTLWLRPPPYWSPSPVSVSVSDLHVRRCRCWKEHLNFPFFSGENLSKQCKLRFLLAFPN